jgi:calcineurin-like phosphoesterase family protein
VLSVLTVLYGNIMSNIWFTSDTHFNHKAVLGYCNRPFQSAEEMNEVMIKDFNHLVGVKDVVYHLGDFAFAGTEVVKSLRGRLNGTIHLIKGNHDYKWSKVAFGAFDSVENLRQIKMDGITIVLCHFPLLSWNKRAYGAWHLHGHSHGATPFDPSVKRMDVGVDCHDYKPVSYDFVRSVLEDKIEFKYKTRYHAEERYADI